MNHGAGALSICAVLALASACGGQGSTSAPPVDEPVAAPSSASIPTSTSTPAPSPTAEPATPSDSATPSEDAPDVDESEEEDETGGTPRPPVLDQGAVGRNLTTADFFKTPEEWRNGRFNVAGKEQLSGVGGPVNDCRDEPDESTPTIELRLANNFQKIRFDFGQGDDSDDADAVLYVQVDGNSEYIDQRSVPFNKIRAFEAPVANVNALEIRVWVGGKNCDYDTNLQAVLTNLQLE